MTDPRTTDPPRPDDDRAEVDRDQTIDRAAKIDDLLLAGLEHYFAGRLQEAVNVWGRVLFLDRAHARARAYIDRARGALAEQQRRSEELVQEGVAALQRGDRPAARELLTSAVEEGDPHDMARAYLERLDRLSASRTTGPRTTGGVRYDAAPQALTARRLFGRARRPVRALPLVLGALLACVGIYIAASRDLLKPIVDAAWAPRAPASAVSVGPDALSVPRSADIGLARARDLLAGGHLKAALAELDRIPDADALAPEARRLRVEIQRALLESVQGDRTAGAGPGPAAPPVAGRAAR